jgi:hypothetical protein
VRIQTFSLLQHSIRAVINTHPQHFIKRVLCAGNIWREVQFDDAENNEGTFKWLQAAYEDHAVWMGYLAVDPIFDRYRSDERFKDLLRRVGLS